MLTGSGEPALYSKFGVLVDLIKRKYRNAKIMAYTNASLLSRNDVINEFSKCDIIGCNLNAVYDIEFQNACRPLDTVKLKSALEGLLRFKKQFQGVLFVDTKFVPGINDTERNLLGLIDYLKELSPDKYTIIHRKFKGQEPEAEFIDLSRERISELTFTTNIVNI